MSDTVVAGCSTVAWDHPTATVRTCVVDLELVPSMAYADDTTMTYADSTPMEYAA